jgi:two-component system, OmpR family, sensor histidine kinase MprB
MSFRRRITLVAAAAVAVAIVLASLLTYVLTSDQLHRQVDAQLRTRGHAAVRLERFLKPRRGSRPALSDSERLALDLNGVAGDSGKEAAEDKAGSASGSADGRYPQKVSYGAGARNLFGRLPPGPDQVRGYQQVVNASGRIVVRSAHDISLPVDAATVALARHGGRAFLRDAHINGVHVRILAESFGNGRVVQLAQPVTEVDSLLARLRLILALLVLGGVALAALLGRLIAGAAVQPLKRLTAATEHVAATRDLSRRIEPVGEDEIGRLAASFNEMLDALERSVSALDASVHAQRQLVADASHELRTPVTSLRTNIEILQQQGAGMEREEQRRLLTDVVEQIQELTLVINDLIDLARGEEQREDSEELRLDTLVEEVVARARRHSPATLLSVELEPTLVTGVPARLERAVGNLVDNALKYSPPGEPVEIALQGTQLTVRDHGPGISDEDLPHIFDRFYRGAESRGLPGSGLGLAIVRQVATQQGGAVTAEPAAGGGTLMRLRLPGAEPLAAEARGGAGRFAGEATTAAEPFAGEAGDGAEPLAAPTGRAPSAGA